MKYIRLIVIPVILFFVVLGTVFVTSSGPDSFQNSFLYTQLNLLDGYWFTTATANPHSS